MLNIIFRLHQYKGEIIGPIVIPALYQHRANIMAFMAQPSTDQDMKDMLNEEIVAVDEALAAPSRPFVRNFEQQTEEEKVRDKSNKGTPAASKPSNMSGLSLKH